jgi:hypothetical protein
MSSDESLSRVRRYRPRLRLVAELERVRLAASFFLALVFTAGFGCCCVLPMPGAPHDMALIVQASVVVVLWCWLIGRLTLFSPTQRLRQALDHYGEARRLIKEIDAEWREAPEVWTWPRWPPRGLAPAFIVLSQNWLIQVRGAGAEAIKLGEVLWIYKRAPRRRAWAWSTRQRVRLGCRLRYRGDYYIEGRAQVLDELAEELLERRPGLLAGWRSEYVDLMKRGPAALWEAYELRAEKFARLSPDERERWLDEAFARYEAAPLNVE